MVCEYSVVEELMLKKGVKPADVCRDLGFDPSMFTCWKKPLDEPKAYRPKVDKLLKLAKFFDVPLETFIKEEP